MKKTLITPENLKGELYLEINYYGEKQTKDDRAKDVLRLSNLNNNLRINILYEGYSSGLNPDTRCELVKCFEVPEGVYGDVKGVVKYVYPKDMTEEEIELSKNLILTSNPDLLVRAVVQA